MNLLAYQLLRCHKIARIKISLYKERKSFLKIIVCSYCIVLFPHYNIGIETQSSFQLSIGVDMKNQIKIAQPVTEQLNSGLAIFILAEQLKRELKKWNLITGGCFWKK